MSQIFAAEAPRYWAAGLPAIPLMEKQKRPAVNGWQLFADRLPTDDEKEAWLNHFPDGNIGLPMGPAAGLVAVDIDTDDPKVLAVLDAILPKSPWIRIGKKGAVKVFRYNGERTTRIKGADGAMICEILSKGTQFVLPPSIHPDTQLPYQANCHLLDVISIIPALPVGIEDLIRDALNEAGIEVATAGSNKITNFVPAGARDNTMVWHAGLLARAVTRGERTLLEALGEMQQWVENYVEQVVGDPLTVEKAQRKVVEYLVKDVTGERRISLSAGWDKGMSDEDKANLGLSFTAEDEHWDAARMIEYLSNEFAEHPEQHSAGRRKAIDTVLGRLARPDGAFSRIDEHRILRYITDRSDKTLNTATLRAELRDLRRGDIAGDSHSNVANAVKERIDQSGELRFHAGRFWQWKGAHWKEMVDSAITTIVGEEFGNFPASRRNSDYRQIVSYLGALSASALQRDNTPGINFANGYLTQNFELVPHDPDFGCTYILPYRYMPELAGKAPLFDQFLYDSWGADPDFEQKVMALQEAMGAILFREASRQQRAFLFYGAARSGKTTLADIIQGLLPTESVSNIPPDQWGDRFLPAEMYGKVLNRAGDMSENARIKGDMFKQIVGGEAIEVQRKFQQPFSFEPKCAQVFCSNYLPKTHDYTDGFNRRWLIFAFPRAVPEADRDTSLAEKISREEQEAVAAWAVEGFKRLQQRANYTLPSSHEANIERMMMANNAVLRFLNTWPKVRIGAAAAGRGVSLVQLYGEYRSWVLADGSARLSSANFDERMRELENRLGFVTDTTDGVVYRGVWLAP